MLKCLIVFIGLGLVVWAADDKKDLYDKATQAVAVGDALNARDLFCKLAQDAPQYKDVVQQCAIFKPLAEKTLNRYKVNYAEGMLALDAHDYATAEKKFKLVRAGEFAESAKKKIVETDELARKARIKGVQDSIRISDSAKQFESGCGRTLLEGRSFSESDNPTDLFCVGFVRGLADLAQEEGIACAPSDVNVDKEVAVLLEFIKAHPEKRELPTSRVLKEALRGTYPCSH